MKIGIITIFNVTNFGAELQAFSLVHKIRTLGYEAVVINYPYFKNWRRSASGIGADQRFSLTRLFRRVLIYGFSSILMEYPVRFIVQLWREKYLRYQRFQKCFVDCRLILNRKGLRKIENNFDLWMVGSDQVWNPNTEDDLSPYLLEWVQGKKVSYASSFGVSEIPDWFQSKVKASLGSFNFISCREKSGVNILKTLGFNDAKQVLDPTLLLDKVAWQELIASVDGVDKGYVLIYNLGRSERVEEAASKIAKERGMRIVEVSKRPFGYKRKEGIEYVDDAGPLEFVRLISEANCVVTDSFHGTAFSVNLAIPFYSFINPEKKNNSRILGFLEELNLSHRAFGSASDLVLADNSINYLEVQKQLSSLRDDSVLFLKDAIGESSK